MKKDEFSAFKKSYAHSREFRPDEADWDLLNERLAMQKQRRRGGLFAQWWLAAACLVLLLLSGIFWANLRESKNFNRQLVERIDSLMQGNKVQQQIVERVKTDTIYIEKWIYVDQEKDKTITVNSYFSVPYVMPDDYPALYASASIGGEGQHFRTSTLLLSLSAGMTPSPTSATATTTQVSFLPARRVAPELPSSLASAFALPLPVKADKVLIHKYPFRPLSGLQPLGIHLGIIGGFGFLPNGIDDQGYQEIGLQADIRLGNRLSLQPRLLWTKLHYRLATFDEALGAPEVEAPSPGLIFQAAEVLQPTFDYSLGLQYRFRSKGVWHPYLELSYGQRKLESYQVFYNFKDETTDVELEVDYQRAEQRLFFLEGSLGFQRNLGKKWQLGLAANYRKTSAGEQTRLPASLGVMARVGYRIR